MFGSRKVTVSKVLASVAICSLTLSMAATGVQAQTALPGNAPPLTNPLVLTNPVTGAQVQIMPTTAYLAQQAPGPGASGGTTPPSSAGTLPSPTCTLGTDPSTGDAHVLVNSSSVQFDSLDITAFGLSSNTSTLTGQLSTQSLSNGTPVNGTPAPATPQVAGGGNVWYLVWNYGSDPTIKGYFLETMYPGDPAKAGYVNDASTSNLPVNFAWGTIVVSATGGQQFTTGGPATGTFDTANNRITMSVPLSSVGGASAGATLSSPLAEGDALVGTPASGGLLETADKLSSSSTDYHVGNSGTHCPSSKQGSTSPGLPTSGNANNLSYYGGPVVHSITNHIIWWLPKAGTTTYSDGSACTEPGTVTYSYEQPVSGTAPIGALPGGPHGDADYKAIISQYFNDLSGTSFYNLMTQYADFQQGAVVNSQTLGAGWTDSCGYTSTPSTTTGPVPGGTEAAPMYQTDIQAEVQRAMAINHWPAGLGNQYYVYTGYGAADCFAPPGQASLTPTCSVVGPKPVYCAYHGDFQDNAGNYVLYANMADGAFAANPTAINNCYTAPIGVSDPAHSVNGSQVTDPIADAEVSITSHEQFETVTDAEVGTASQYAPPLAWYEQVNGEIGDKCAYNYGNYASDGSNVILHGNHYIVQQEYSNWNNGCGISPYQGNGGYGGDAATTTIQQGWNLISVPVTGITDTAKLVADMQRPGQRRRAPLRKFSYTITVLIRRTYPARRPCL